MIVAINWMPVGMSLWKRNNTNEWKPSFVSGIWMIFPRLVRGLIQSDDGETNLRINNTLPINNHTVDWIHAPERTFTVSNQHVNSGSDKWSDFNHLLHLLNTFLPSNKPQVTKYSATWAKMPNKQVPWFV